LEESYYCSPIESEWRRPLSSLCNCIDKSGNELIEITGTDPELFELFPWIMGNMLIADMRRYLGQGLGIIELPAPAARLRDYPFSSV
jgi:hypothetical protein